MEVKFVLPRGVLSNIDKIKNLETSEIEQIYLDEADLELFAEELSIPNGSFTEFRIRQKGDEFSFTAKGASKNKGVERAEHNTDIAEELFNKLKDAAKQSARLNQIKKTRYSFSAKFANEDVLVEIDDYHATGKGEHNLDFVTCEIEVPEIRLANILMSGRFFSPDLLFLKKGFNVTGIKDFSNRHIAQRGFIDESFEGIFKWLKQSYCNSVKRSIDELSDRENCEGLKNIRDDIRNVELLVHKASDADIDINDISMTQDILADLKFTVIQSYGRKDKSNKNLAKLDSLGKGWLSDYHKILSTNAYLRLNYKPQVFRPGVGNIYTNTTTRGAHTSDVIASSMELAKQMGLNMDLCMACAAMHDIGHPAGGHVGEEILYKLTGKTFKHHVFSLSLAEIYNLNLLVEVMVGSLYHKTSGGPLEAPAGLPEEFGIIRIADKISYCPWDFFDSIVNGYLPKNLKVIKDIKYVLGEEPMDWISKFTNSIVRESAEAHHVQFSEKSGDIFEAYKTAKKLITERVHNNINWDTLESQIKLCYEKIEKSFPDIDPVPVIAYITDTELTGHIESRPKDKKLDLEELEVLGFGFCDLIVIMQDKNFNKELLYYESYEDM